MRHHLALAAAAGAVLLAGAGCGSDSGTDQLPPDVAAACGEYSQIVNAWSRDYGAEMGAVGEAASNGDESRQDEAVEVVRDLFLASADDLRAQAGTTSDEELAEGLNQAADGLAEIAEGVESYDDVEAAPARMSEGAFAAGGKTVSEVCSG